MNKYMNRLPMELIHHILSYSYKPQPKKLQEDIISYYTTKKEIFNIFGRRYHTNDIISMHKMLSFHIQCFLTGLPNTNTYGNCENIYRRLFIWNSLCMRYKLNPLVSDCIFWGLLLVEERAQFVEIQKEMDSRL
jgi:hypothetical protein